MGDPFHDPALARRRRRERDMRIRSIPTGPRRGVALEDCGLADGLPLRSVAFYAVAVVVSSIDVWAIASVVPWLGFSVPWWIAYVVIPMLVSAKLTALTAPPPPPVGLDYDRIAQLERAADAVHNEGRLT